MMPDPAPVVIYVTYQGTLETRFDRAYYVDHHLPAVMLGWQAYGLLGITAFFPAAEHAGTIAICECHFRDEAAFDDALASPETATLMADVPRFTDVAPRRSRAVPL